MTIAQAIWIEQAIINAAWGMAGIIGFCVLVWLYLLLTMPRKIRDADWGVEPDTRAMDQRYREAQR